MDPTPISTSSTHHSSDSANSTVANSATTLNVTVVHTFFFGTPLLRLRQKRHKGMEVSEIKTVIILRKVAAKKAHMEFLALEKEKFKAVADTINANIAFFLM